MDFVHSVKFLALIELVEIQSQRREIIDLAKASGCSFQVDRDVLVGGAVFRDRTSHVSTIILPEGGEIRAGDVNLECGDLRFVEKGLTVFELVGGFNAAGRSRQYRHDDQKQKDRRSVIGELQSRQSHQWTSLLVPVGKRKCFWQATLTGLKLLELRTNSPLFTMENGHSARHGEAAFAGIAGVKKQRLADLLIEGLVCVAEYDRVRIIANQPALDYRRRGPDIHDVMDQEFASVESNQFSLFEIEADIVVAEHGSDRRDGFQLENHPRQTDVARMQDMVHTLKQLRHPGVQMIVGI